MGFTQGNSHLPVAHHIPSSHLDVLYRVAVLCNAIITVTLQNPNRCMQQVLLHSAEGQGVGPEDVPLLPVWVCLGGTHTETALESRN